jgi:hypothetical protein
MHKHTSMMSIVTVHVSYTVALRTIQLSVVVTVHSVVLTILKVFRLKPAPNALVVHSYWIINASQLYKIL